MNPTLAKSKAARLASPVSLSITPNTRVVMAAALVSLPLQREQTSIVTLINPATTLNIDVDAQNFSAMGGQFFILKADTTNASTITVSYVHANSTKASHVFSVAADSIGQLVLGAVVTANNHVDLVVIGHHVVGKPNATGDQADISGLTLHNLSYLNDTLHYTGSTGGGASVVVELLSYQPVNLTVPVGPLDFSVVLSSHASLADDTAQLASLHLSAADNGYTGIMVGNQDNSQALTANAGDVINLINHGNSQMGISISGGQTLYSRVNPALATAPKVYLHLVFSSTSTIADMPFVILPQPFEA